MKYTLIVLTLGAAVVGSVTFYKLRTPAAPAAVPPAVSTPSTEMPSVATVAFDSKPTASETTSNAPATLPAQPATTETATTAAAATPFSRAIDLLVSPQSTFQQRQSAWKQLRDAGQLDQAIATLQQGATANPTDAGYPTALGEAYINKLRSDQNYNDKAILALQADRSFDTALALDPANWDAQYYKAASLSHWPAEMNKDPEVIQRLSALIDQQEAAPSQPQFAQTYVLLGDEYQKTGQADYAVQTWRMGAAKFPGDPTLRSRLSHR